MIGLPNIIFSLQKLFTCIFFIKSSINIKNFLTNNDNTAFNNNNTDNAHNTLEYKYIQNVNNVNNQKNNTINNSYGLKYDNTSNILNNKP